MLRLGSKSKLVNSSNSKEDLLLTGTEARV